MSLNIDTSRILPVKVSGVSPNLLSRSVTLPQSCNVCESWENVPLEFSRLSIDSVIVSVALRSCDPFNPFLPSFVGFPDVDGSFQDTTQNLRRRRLLCAED